MLALASKSLSPINLDIEAACVAAQGVAAFVAKPAVRKRFQALADAGEFDMTHLDGIAPLAAATRHARREADKAIGKGTSVQVRLPPDLVQLAATLEKRMQACAEHTLSAIPPAVKELERLSPGTGYVDLAGDLDGYADLYAQHPDEVRLDGVNYRDGDAAQARKLAKQLLEALGSGLSDEARRRLDLTARAWTLLAGAYAEVSAAGWFLFRDDDAAGKFPSLYAAGRFRSGRGKKGKPRPTAPAPAGTGTPA
jgi:hypothetical protein